MPETLQPRAAEGGLQELLGRDVHCVQTIADSAIVQPKGLTKERIRLAKWLRACITNAEGSKKGGTLKSSKSLDHFSIETYVKKWDPPFSETPILL